LLQLVRSAMRWHLALAICLSTLVPCAGADVREMILREYERSTQATELKYLDGVYCIRAPGFRLLTIEGLVLDPRVERMRLEQFLGPALSVREQIYLESLEMKSGDEAVCTITCTTNLTTFNRVTGRKESQVLVTRSRDDWVLLAKQRWRLRVSQILSQDYKR